ncbi:Creatinine amidohydrolase [Raoultella terrigena]|uniref:Creatinine amidohydrolase n=1 Tax=Raoultella terrigena TaxID=577 RepID=A0A4U9CWA2_RAOTE|nr:Creatinine amidohydrolase [Raoultella terrigena]
MAGYALARLPKAIPAYAIPPVTYGKSDEHLNFPGTLTLTGDTLLQTILEIAESLYRAGFRKLLMINGHGGQPQVLQMASREMRLRHGDMIMIPHDVFRVPNVENEFLSAQEQKMAMHAGHSETAVMLALAPECVHIERAVANYPPEFPCPTLSSGRPAAAWASYDFGPSGVIGDPTGATAEQGTRSSIRWRQAGHRRLPKSIIWNGKYAASQPGGKHHWNGFVQTTFTPPPSSFVSK